MATVTTYSSLQTWLANFLNRNDLTTDIDAVIQDAEAKMRSDSRLRLPVYDGAFAVASAATTTALPSDFAMLDDSSHIGSTFYGPINIIPSGEIGRALASYGDTGAPAVVAVVRDAAGNWSLRWAPVPDQAFTIQLNYWAKPPKLSSVVTTSLWLTEYPHIYRLASLAVLAGYLREDERTASWLQQYEDAADKIYEDVQDAQFGGDLERVPGRTF